MIKPITAKKVIEIFGDTVVACVPHSFEDLKKTFEKHSSIVQNSINKFDKKIFNEEIELYKVFQKDMILKIDQAYEDQKNKQKFYKIVSKNFIQIF